MPEDFVPTTTMERAYVQARHWPADRAWRRAYVQMSEGRVAPGVGMYLCLLEHYARRDGIRELFETCEWLLTRMENLKPAERLSMCRIVCDIVKSLKEDEFNVQEARLKLILRIPLAVILDAVAEQRLSCALTGLLEFSRVFEESITIKQCSDIEGDYMGVALAIDRAIRAGNVRDKVKASEAKTREEYDRERLEAINMAEVIKEKLKQQNPALSEDAREHAWKAVKDAIQVWRSTTSAKAPTVEEMKSVVEGVLRQADAAPPEQDSSQSGEIANVDKLTKAQSELESATKLFGLRSDQVAHKLADLIVVKSEHFPDMVLDADIQRLNEIVTDESVDISPYVLRKILSAVGATDERKDLLKVLTAIETSVLSKREKQLGIDISLGITLWRLISLWRANESLAEGSAYCELLRQRLVDHRGMGDPVVRQVSSAIKFIAFLKSGRFKWKERFLGAQSKKYDEAAEFAAMLSTIALDDISSGRLENSELVMNELLCFYADTVGDTSRQVGEMLWLLQETQLNQLQKVALSLIKQSQKCSRDDYLDARLGSNFRRLIVLIEDKDRRTELVSSLLLARQGSNIYDKAIEETKQIVALCTFKECYENEAKAERKRIMTGKSLMSKSSSVLIKLELHCMEKNWKEFSKKLSKDGPSINVEESFYSLVQLGIQLIKNQQLEHSEYIVNMLFPHATSSCVGAFNLLTEELKRQLVIHGEFERASAILELALSGQFQSAEFKNRFCVQLAEVKALTGSLFDTTVLLYRAFSDIPDVDSAQASIQLEMK